MDAVTALPSSRRLAASDIWRLELDTSSEHCVHFVRVDYVGRGYDLTLGRGQGNDSDEANGQGNAHRPQTQIYAFPARSVSVTTEEGELSLEPSAGLCGTPFYGCARIPRSACARRLQLPQRVVTQRLQLDELGQETRKQVLGERSSEEEDGVSEAGVPQCALPLPWGLEYVVATLEVEETVPQPEAGFTDTSGSFIHGLTFRHADHLLLQMQGEQTRQLKGRWDPSLECFRGLWRLKDDDSDDSMSPFNRWTLCRAHDHTWESGRSPTLSVVSPGYVCPGGSAETCDRTFSSCSTFVRHKAETGHGSAKCVGCNEFLPSRSAAKKHRLMGHADVSGVITALRESRVGVKNRVLTHGQREKCRAVWNERLSADYEGNGREEEWWETEEKCAKQAQAQELKGEATEVQTLQLDFAGFDVEYGSASDGDEGDDGYYYSTDDYGYDSENTTCDHLNCDKYIQCPPVCDPQAYQTFMKVEHLMFIDHDTIAKAKKEADLKALRRTAEKLRSELAEAEEQRQRDEKEAVKRAQQEKAREIAARPKHFCQTHWPEGVALFAKLKARDHCWMTKALETTRHGLCRIYSTEQAGLPRDDSIYHATIALLWYARAYTLLEAQQTTQALAAAEYGLTLLDKVKTRISSDACSLYVKEEIGVNMIDLSARAAMSQIQASLKGVSARFLVEYCLSRPAIQKDHTTDHVVHQQVKPETAPFHLSWIDAFPEPALHALPTSCRDNRLGPASMFVSHAWAAPWMSVVQAVVLEQLIGPKDSKQAVLGAFEVDASAVGMELYERANTANMGRQLEIMLEALDGCTKPVRYFWLDIFCKNQHDIDSDDTAVELSTTLKQTGQAMLVLEPLDNPISLSRVWCLFEVLTCVKAEVGMDIAPSFAGMHSMDDLVLHNRGKLVSATVADPMVGALVAHRGEMCGSIHVEQAKAAVEHDRKMILDLVDNTVGTDRMNGIVRQTVDRCLLDWQTATIRHWARQRKSRKWEKRVEAMEELRTQLRRARSFHKK